MQIILIFNLDNHFAKFIILGCGSSMGVPRYIGYFGKCNPNNKKNIRTKCSIALLKWLANGLYIIDLHLQI